MCIDLQKRICSCLDGQIGLGLSRDPQQIWVQGSGFREGLGFGTLHTLMLRADSFEAERLLESLDENWANLSLGFDLSVRP